MSLSLYMYYLDEDTPPNELFSDFLQFSTAIGLRIARVGNMKYRGTSARAVNEEANVGENAKDCRKVEISDPFPLIL